ncbi:MAG: hypothetical protein AAFX05_03290 [Planctomycetota bacterium]
MMHPLALLGQSTGFRPFLEPLPLHEWWWITLIPMALLTSIAYKAVRMPQPKGARYVRSVGIMAAQIVIAMVVISLLLYVLVERIVPLFESA